MPPELDSWTEALGFVLVLLLLVGVLVVIEWMSE